jgi:hypothetical protein
MSAVHFIQASGNPLAIELTGMDDGHGIEDVLFQNVLCNGKALTRDGLKANAFVKNLRILP